MSCQMFLARQHLSSRVKDTTNKRIIHIMCMRANPVRFPSDASDVPNIERKLNTRVGRGDWTTCDFRYHLITAAVRCEQLVSEILSTSLIWLTRISDVGCHRLPLGQAGPSQLSPSRPKDRCYSFANGCYSPPRLALAAGKISRCHRIVPSRRLMALRFIGLNARFVLRRWKRRKIIMNLCH